MGTEYYLVKPNKKEIFYLGKHFSCPMGIPNSTYSEKAKYLDYENFEEFFWDMLKENWEYFANCELLLTETFDIIYKIYEWCENNKVFLSNDCREDATKWLNYKETGDITKLLETIHMKRE